MKVLCCCCGEEFEISMSEFIQLIEDDDEYICNDCASACFEIIEELKLRKN